MVRDEIKKILNINDAEIERSENKNFGDYSTNAALKLAKKEGKNPIEIAEEIKSQAEKESGKLIEKIEIAPPGFVNFFIAKEYLQREAGQILKEGEDYGKLDIGQNKKVQVEFISGNPTGPLTLGNGRGGIFGDILSNIFKKGGYEVVKEYFINDAGNQIDILGHSVLKDDQAEYKGDYIDELVKIIKEKDPRLVGQKSAEYIMTGIKDTATAMSINFDEWFSEERELRKKGKIDEVIGLLKEKDLVYEKDGASWFKATKFFDTRDRVLIKKDGEPTYFAADCAYHINKFIERKFDKVINVWGADHHGDVAGVKSFVASLGDDYIKNFEIILLQFVSLIKEGAEVRMSKRTGNYILVDDLLKEVGKDIFRFFMAMYSPNTHIDFDLDIAKEQSEKNPVYYVQYAYARISSILAKLKIKNEKLKITVENLKLLNHEAELSLIKQLIRLPEVIEDTMRDYQVQRLPQYALELVRAFHKFYEECRVIDEKNQDLTQARLALVEATRIVLKNTLDLMGISAPEKM